MNTYSRRRRTFLSLLLSVAMVLSYSTAFLGTSAEDVYADTSVITFDIDNMDDDGALHFKLEEGYTQDDSWLGISYVANTDMDLVKNYVEFELLGSSGFTLNTYTDSPLASGSYQSVSFVPDEGLEVGTYNLTLNVYEDANGTGSFEGNPPAATYSIVVDVVPFQHYWFEAQNYVVHIFMLEGLEPAASAMEFPVNITNRDDEFTGDSLSQHAQFEFTGDDAECFYVDGLDDIVFPSPEEYTSYELIYIRPVEGLAAGEYSAELNIYLDNTGEKTPYERTIPVDLNVGEREDYGFEMSVDNYGYFNALSKNYTSDDLINNTATVTIRNTGKNPFTVDPSQIGVFASYEGEGSIESGDFTVEPLFAAPRELAVGESIDVATVAPAMGLEVGLYNADLEYSIENDNGGSIGSVHPLEFRVLNDTASLVYQDEPVDFGAYRPGFPEGATTDLHVDLMNDGNVPLKITNVTEPENGPFAGLTEDDYQTWPIQSTEYGWICVSLDPESPYAEQLGTYEGNYVVTAKECDDEGNIVEGGNTVTVEIPVKVEITDTPPASFETGYGSGPETDWIEFYVTAGYNAEEGMQTFPLMGSYGEHFYGREVGDFVKYGFDETGAELLSIKGFDSTETLPALEQDEQYYKQIELVLAEGLDPGDYRAEVYEYVDPKGTGTFDEDNPTEIIPIIIHVSEGNAFDILPENGEEFRFVLEQGYSEEDAAASAQGVVVRNRTKSDLVIESSDDLGFVSDQETNAFKISYYEEDFPIVIAPGESQKIATITPYAGLDAGKYGAWLQIEAGGNYNSQSVTLVVAKNEASIKWEEEKIDFGYLQPGFDFEVALEKSMLVSGLNDGNTPLRIIDVVAPQESPFRVESGSGYFQVNSGEGFTISIMPEPYSDAAIKTGVYDEVVTVYAQETDENGELVEGGQTVQAELPIHLEITDETYTITVDMQGHGENYELAGLAKGIYIIDKLEEAYNEGWPSAEGKVFFAFGANPLSTYSNWDEYAQDESNNLYRPLVENTTVYAEWLTEYTGAINLEIKAPVCGEKADEVMPQITAPSGAQYEVIDPSWSKGETNWEEYTGEFVGGEEYYARAEIRPAYLQAFPDGQLSVYINGEAYERIGDGRGIAGSFMLWPAVPVTAEHSLIKTEAVDTTCEEDGNIEYWTCEGCGKVFSDAEGKNEIQQADTVVEKTGHALMKTEEVPATCTTEGTQAFWTCSVCHKMFSDENGTNEITAPEVISTKDHNLSKTEKVEAACTTAGVEEYWTCSACGKMFSDAEGKNEINKPVEIPATGHTEVILPAVEPTCTEPGKTEGKKCSVCGEILVAQKELPAEHKYDEGVVTTEPTCTEKGEKILTCSVCGDKKTEEVAAKGHSWGSWTVTKAATISAAGEEEHTCSVCGKTETRAIPKKQETKYSDGWHKIGGYWYYYKNNAPVKNSWMKDSKGWCYLGADGKMVANGWAKDSKGWVWMNGSGYWDTRTRWIKYDGGWYHTTKGYRDQNKWRKDSKGWCYLGSNGRMVTNGWAKDSVGWCWMGSNGYWTSNKWVKDNGEWYYIKRNHYMASNEWAKDSGGWMYMAKNGKITKSKWVKSGGAWYYLKDNGYMATGTLKIGSKTYRFASSGKWID